MLAEEIKHILASVAIDFIKGAQRKREVYLYADDVMAYGVFPLAAKRAIKVTFEYCNVPEEDKPE